MREIFLYLPLAQAVLLEPFDLLLVWSAEVYRLSLTSDATFAAPFFEPWLD